ncbi:T6SS immunity protein Tdi1 domain-containing protein [Schlesneria paludicola]|uniref:T6SS immunity protein Tdi1 domain-containing protein n=1 Tax=Schlesneria paludicola TaxID=360056 RepID=UPI00029A76B5|nr:T6SS immunity protein Tdi1 domain-containing protein [Schlesneria paludicola]
MAISVADYLIDQSGIEWPNVLASWSWLLPPNFTIWLVNRFADLFLVLPNGTVHMLDVGGGTLTKLADSRDEFCAKIDEDDNANQWLMIPLVDQMVAAGAVLQPGKCYGFKTPPVLGGVYTVENVGPLSVWDYLGAYGSIHEQLQDVPDGSQVILKLVHNPDELGPAAVGGEEQAFRGS